MSEQPDAPQFECSTPEAWTELLRTERLSAQSMVAAVVQMRTQRDAAMRDAAQMRQAVADLMGAIENAKTAKEA